MAFGMASRRVRQALTAGRAPSAPTDPGNPFTVGGDFQGAAGRAVAGAGAAGFFNPLGSPQLARLRRRFAVRGARNRRRRVAGASQLFGLDPNASRQALFDVERESGGDISDYLNNAQFQEQQGNQNYFRDLFGQERGFEFQSREAQRERDAAERAARSQMIGDIGTSVGGLATSFIPIPKGAKK